MSVIGSNILAGASGAGGGYQISRSVRLRSSASAFFNRTLTTPTNNRIFTWSGWLKIGTIPSSREGIFVATNAGGTSFFGIEFNPSAGITIWDSAYSAVAGALVTSQVFRDPSSWYHIVLAVNTTQATASNRVKLYVNGSQITALSSANYPALNATPYMNSAVSHSIGSWQPAVGLNFDGYLTEVNFIDGQALTPSSFGETNPVTGVWQPKKYAGTYGTNGFYLNFSDNSAATAAAIGKDYSGNGNNWTPNNISVTAGVTYDSMLDVPTQWADGGNGRGNYATLNPVANPSTLLNANLTTNAGDKFSISTIGMTTGKWYCEVTVTTVGAESSVGISTQPYSGSNPYVGGTSTSWGYYSNNGNKYTNASNAAYGATYTTGDVIGIAFDADNGTLEFFKNNTSQGTAYTGLTSGTYFFAVEGRTTTSANNCSINFGQRPFAYTPPSGFKALNTLNLPTPTILKGNQYFDAVTYSGNSTYPRTIGGLNFQPDLVWQKARSVTYDHIVYDSARGTGTSKSLSTNITSAEGFNSTFANLTAFASDGFTVDTTSGTNVLNNAGQTYVAWQWKEGATQGFDIVTYTGNGTNNRAINHNLGVTPAFIIVKDRTNAFNWDIYHQSLGINATLIFTTAATRNVSAFGTSAPTSTVFYTQNNYTNTNSANLVAYLFAEVAGFSKFGSYTGNGSADGPFVFCGFRPRWILVKNTSAVNQWNVWDTARNTFNVMNDILVPSSSGAETNAYPIDITANGFKIRGGAGLAMNDNGNVYIFAAFAESPFKNSLAR